MSRPATGGARLARRWEHRLYLSAHPAVYPLLTGLGKLAPAVRVPGVGALVSSPTLARQVLTDTERFVKNGPGSSGALWTPVLGPSVLLNMEGAEHRALRSKLAGLFTPAAAAALCARVLKPMGDDVTARLRDGQTVDLVRTTKIAASRVIAELIGFPIPDGPGADRACLELFAAGEQIVAMVRLTTRELRPDQVARAKQVLTRLVEPAARAYRAGDPGTAMGRMAELGLSEDEALGAAAAFFLTGTETVATTVPRVIAMLCDHGLAGSPAPGQGGARAAREPACPVTGAAAEPDGAESSWLDLAIDEAMRVMAPTPATLRSVVAPARVGGVRLRAGDRVIIGTVTCTRAAGPFDPEAIRQGRRPTADLRRLWFGAGPHYCIGAPLALAEIRTLTQAVLSAGPLSIQRRAAARRVLIPAYRLLEVRAA
ncbi:cytochrome P450 [Catenulispora rubra]|uniref:cytochrome P450 n=1 Tax=Catenulispora rubra TaxID=280293 RepID=UPI0018927A29|nr:cytochrome P450 [Catenulispora rubra]